jgi:hypothetical protein
MSSNNEQPSPSSNEQPGNGTPAGPQCNPIGSAKDVTVKSPEHKESESSDSEPDNTRQPQYLRIAGNEIVSVRSDNGRLYNELELHLYKAMKPHRQSLDALITAMVEAMDSTREENKSFWESDETEEERDYHKPFMQLVQSALKLAKERLLDENEFPNLQKDGEMGLSFFVRDRSPTEGYGDLDFERDGVGIVGRDKLEAKQYESWKGGHCVYVAKHGTGSLREAIRQAASHARLMFSCQANRTFAHGLLHICPNLLHLARFDRAGCTYQKTPMDIFQKDGLKKLSHFLVSMLVLPPLYLGIDQTMAPDGSSFTMHDYVCEIQDTLTYRDGLQGTGTRVYLVRPSKRPQARGGLE